MPATTLPALTTLFVGRSAELGQIGQLLSDGACQLLTLTGPGGIGKTRLAVEAARAHSHAFADGVAFVALQPLIAAELIVPAIAEALDIQFFPGGEPKQQLLDTLSSQSMLLILDNFEHLLDGSALVSELMTAAPTLKLLVTSRERLNLLEEWVVDVAGLPFPTAEARPEFGHYDAVRLFAEHARRIQVGFALTPEVESAVARICRLVDGTPLAVELAAAWVRALTCDEIAAEIEHSLDLLVSSARNVAPRHRNMRAVLDHSWSLLTDDERKVFQVLSVFRGGFRKEAAREVAGASPLMLSALVDKSLLRLTGSGRYEVHELLRQYAEEKLREDADNAQARDRHSHYFADFMHDRADDLKGRRQRPALDEIEADFENVRTGWNRAVERQDGEAILRSLESLYLFCEMRSRFHEGMELFWHAHSRLTGQPEVANSAFTRWVELWRLSAQFPEGYETVVRQINACLDSAWQREGRAEAAFCLWTLGVVAHSIGDSVMNGHFEKSMALYEQIGDRFYIAKVADFLAASYSFPDTYNVDQYFKLTHYSIDLRRAIGDRFGLALAITNLKVAAMDSGDTVAAERYLDETDALFNEVGSRFGIIRNNSLRGELAFQAGEFDTARTIIEQVLESLPASIQGGRWTALATLGQIVCMEGDYARGREIGIHMLARTGFSLTENVLAVAACGLDDMSEAARQVLTRLKIHSPFMNILLSPALPVSTIILAREGQLEWAVEVLGQAFTLPARTSGWMERWPLLTETRADLKAALGPDAYAAAWDRGQASQLEAVIAALIAHFEASDAQPLVAQPASPDALSERELEILRLIAEGKSNREIADTLILAVGTVKWYVSQICAKLGVANRVQAIARARDLKLLD